MANNTTHDGSHMAPFTPKNAPKSLNMPQAPTSSKASPNLQYPIGARRPSTHFQTWPYSPYSNKPMDQMPDNALDLYGVYTPAPLRMA